MTENIALRHPTPPVVAALDVAAKAGLVVLLVMSLLFPELGNVEDKAAGLRAVAYPILAFTVPAVWWVFWRERASFPWVAGLMVTSTCFDGDGDPVGVLPLEDVIEVLVGEVSDVA